MLKTLVDETSGGVDLSLTLRLVRELKASREQNQRNQALLEAAARHAHQTANADVSAFNLDHALQANANLQRSIGELEAQRAQACAEVDRMKAELSARHDGGAGQPSLPSNRSHF